VLIEKPQGKEPSGDLNVHGKLEAPRSSETFVSCRSTTRRHNPEYLDLNWYIVFLQLNISILTNILFES
jgi:hypothetical protein